MTETRTQSTQSEATTTSNISTPSTIATDYADQAEKLSYAVTGDDSDGSKAAVEAQFITPHDPVIILGDGGRLPGVPLAEAEKLNTLKEETEDPSIVGPEAVDVDGDSKDDNLIEGVQKSGEGSLRRSMPPSRTNPLFPPLPLYGPSSIMRDVHCYTFRISSFFLSLTFLMIIVLGSAFTSIPIAARHIWLRITFRDPDARRPFHLEEKAKQQKRKTAEHQWKVRSERSKSATSAIDNEKSGSDEFVPTEGGKDPLVCDAAYYARRVGLDIEEFKVQTEDGFIITLWHVYDPVEMSPLSPEERAARGPDIFESAQSSPRPSRYKNPSKKPKFPILMIHGLLQSAGAYCTNDDDSLAFYLCKSGYDVWLGNNRCGFKPEHTLLSYADPRMWAWNIRQMGVMDLPALTSRVLSETGFQKLGLIAHSQGTTQTFVALAKEQRPDIGEKLTVFCALAPAAYAGPLIGKAYFKFMRVISPSFFRIVFGIHAFIPFMMTMHATLPGGLYGAMGYRVFSFLFNWSDDRWDRGLRDRMFQFSPVYVSAESMRWWLGRECFAQHKCILATKEEGINEEKEDEMEDYYHRDKKGQQTTSPPRSPGFKKREKKPKGHSAWYNEQVPPFAMWVAGNDDLVDGNRLLRRFDRGREPHVKVVHQKVIPEYEHLDVIWAMDCIEKVGQEVRDVLWKTCNARDRVRTPKGCENVDIWDGISLQEDGEGDESREASSSSEEMA